jgi:hypothetical protein
MRGLANGRRMERKLLKTLSSVTSSCTRMKLKHCLNRASAWRFVWLWQVRALVLPAPLRHCGMSSHRVHARQAAYTHTRADADQVSSNDHLKSFRFVLPLEFDRFLGGVCVGFGIAAFEANSLLARIIKMVFIG